MTICFHLVLISFYPDCIPFLGALLGLGVFSIYGYSMFAVKQEKFLDDFDEPLKEEIQQQ